MEIGGHTKLDMAKSGQAVHPETEIGKSMIGSKSSMCKDPVVGIYDKYKELKAGLITE